jgi:hypothetical protein
MTLGEDPEDLTYCFCFIRNTHELRRSDKKVRKCDLELDKGDMVKRFLADQTHLHGDLDVEIE